MVVGLGYVGLSNAVLLAQHYEVIGVDISQERVNDLNARKSPIVDIELSEYLTVKGLNLKASTDLESSVRAADYVIFSPESLREGNALYDNLYPSRIIVGEKSKRAGIFAQLLSKAAIKKISTSYRRAPETRRQSSYSQTATSLCVLTFLMN